MITAAESYSRHRVRALHSSREALGIGQVSEDAPVWGVLMEWVAPRALATCSATADGGALLFFSEGSELAGDAEPGSEPLLQAVSTLHEIANSLRHLLKPAETFPLPKADRVQFLLRTDAAVISASAREIDLRARRHRLWSLYIAAHEVATALYVLDELRYSSRG